MSLARKEEQQSVSRSNRFRHRNERTTAHTHATTTKQVYKGRRRCTGQITAMKFIVKQGKSEKDIRNLRQEIEILRRLRHENIVQMLDAFETRDHFVVVMGELTGERRERETVWVGPGRADGRTGGGEESSAARGGKS